MKKNRRELENEERIRERNLRQYMEMQEKYNYNPLPQRNNTPEKLKSTEEDLSNFINCSQGYFNKGKYKGIFVKKVNQKYLLWVLDNIELNDSEIKLIKKFIKK